MSELVFAAAAGLPCVAGWAVHALRLTRRIEAARRDPLTGLLTREPFEKRAARLLRSGPCAVAMVDLDGFKAVNDRFGHAAGDAAIRAAGASLTAVAHERHGVAARLGGDEFAVVVPTVDPVAMPRLLRWLYDEICTPFPNQGRKLSVGASVGACWSGDLPAPDLSVALRRADEVMYVVKRSGGGWMDAAPDAKAISTIHGRRYGRPGTRGVA